MCLVARNSVGYSDSVDCDCYAVVMKLSAGWAGW